TNIEAENPASLVILNKQTKSPSKTNKKSKKESQKNLMDSIKGKINKHGKNKLMYANFSIPDEDRHKISLLKETLLSLGIKAKKNEILRAGLYALETLTQQNLKKIFGKMEQTKIRKAK
ncbi:MAG: hypothetical protein KGL58_00580, partial [Pseudomonadota bacterium]|nr:hypothetical protein [Pseudomonadota bacterium]